MFTAAQIKEHRQRLRQDRKRESARAARYRKRHNMSLLEASTTEAQRKQLIQETMERALQQDQRCVDLMVNRIQPPLRPQEPTVNFELCLDDAGTAARDVLRAVSDGILTPTQGKDLLASLNSATQIGELQRLTQEVAELREQVARQGQKVLPATPTPVIDGEPAQALTGAPAWDGDW